MTELASFRVQTDPVLRERFKLACATAGVTMTAQTIKLITAWLLPPASDAQPPDVCPSNPRVAPTGEEPPVALTREFLGEVLKAYSNNIAAVLQTLATHGQLAELQSFVQQQHGQRHDQDAKQISAIREVSRHEIAVGRDRFIDAIEVRWRFWRCMGYSVVGGLVGAFALLWAISGTRPAISIASWLTGGGTTWEAATLIAGKGSRLQGPLMEETSALMNTPAFRDQYAGCIGRAFRAHAPFRCRLDMPTMSRGR